MTNQPTDTYAWIGGSGALWNSGSSWADVTSSTSPAGQQPVAQTPVVISGPTGAPTEVIAGGGTAASIQQTGLVDLSGTYVLGGMLSVGTPETLTIWNSTAGSLVEGAGSAISAAAVVLNSGTITLANGASLTTGGSVTVGLPTGFVQPSGGYYIFEYGGAGLLSVAAGGHLSATGSLAVADGSLVVSGTSANATIGALSLGLPPTTGIATPLGWSTPDNYGTQGDLSVGAGGTVTVSGSVTAPDGAIIVSGSGARLSVAGTVSLQAADASTSFALQAVDGGSVQAAGLTFQQFGTDAGTGSLSLDGISAVEIGSAGNATAGALTVDAGATVATSISTSITAPRIVDNGTIADNGGTLTLNGPISGSGVLRVGANDRLQLEGAVSASNTISLTGTAAALEIGASALNAVKATIAGFAVGDSITFDNVVATGATYIATGPGIGTLELLDGITQVGAVTLAGAYTGASFAQSPTSSGGATVTILHINAGGITPLSTSADSYTWIGASNGAWASATGWADVTSNTSPAGLQPGAQTPVAITGPTSGTSEVILGGGTAASVVQTGLVDLLGTYAFAGALSVGSPETANITTSTPGSLSESTGSAISATAVALNSGTIALVNGATLTTGGSVTVGLPTGFVLPNGGFYVFESGAAGLLSVGTGARLTAAGSLAVTNGSIVVSGTGATVTVGALSLGSAASVGTATPSGWSTPDNYGTEGDLSVGAGGTVTVSGAVTAPDGTITVSGTGARLSVAGALQSSGASAGLSLEALAGGSVQAAGLTFQKSGSSAATGSILVDGTSTVEIGSAGSAAAGALTVDNGATVAASMTTSITAPRVIDNGMISDTGGTLTVTGSISGTGVLQAGANDRLQLAGAVAASNTIGLTGTAAALEIGATALNAVKAKIDGFGQGNAITFDGVVATGATYTTTGIGIGTLTLLNGSTQVAAVNLAGTYAGDTFSLTPTAAGGETVTIGATGTPRTLVWTGGADTNFASPGNWNDTTLNQNPATTAPDGLDTATFTNAGGVITGTGATAALSFGGNGAWNLTSAATLIATDSLTVGSSQASVLVLNDQASVIASGAAVIAAQSGSDGAAVSVDGQGSNFEVGGALTVGSAAAGSLSINAGGSVTAASLAAGVAADGSGVISVTGTQSALTTAGSLSIGGAGIGELSILNGASVGIGGDLNIGQVKGGAGNVDVQGTATLVVGGNLNFGAGGPAELTVGPNATFQLDNGILNGNTSNATLTLFTTIDPLASNGVNQNIKSSGTQAYAGYVNNSPFNLAPGISYTLNTPVIEGAAAFTLGASDTTLVLNADTVSSGTTIAFTDNTGRLVIGSDVLGTIDIQNGGSFTAEANPNKGMPLIGGFSGMIAGFVAGDTVAVDTTLPATFSQTGSIVSVLANGGTLGTLRFDTSGAATAAVASGLVDQVLCFLPDTLIATPSGDVPVQRLAVGDRVLTASGSVRPVAWIGEGRVLATRGRRSAATPVIVRKGALAPNVPHTDLRVTKGHALLFDDVLIPVEFLVNHRSILWDDRAREVSLYHVELDAHDVLMANGAPAESYRDDGNRWLFQNANSGWGLAAKLPCAPVLTGGPVVDAVWQRLLERSGPRPGVPLTQDADVHLMVDGARVDGSRSMGRVVFRLPSPPSTIRLVSRAASPAELGLMRDPRVLGVAVRRIEAWQGAHVAVIEAGDDRMVDGFHGFEADEGIRWTEGDAGVPQEMFEGCAGALEVVVHLAGTTWYPVSGEAAAA